MGVVGELIPSIVVLGFFIAILVTALRATDRAGRDTHEDESPRRDKRDGKAPKGR